MMLMILLLILKKAEEGNLLATILTKCSGSLRKLALDIVAANEEGLSTFEQMILPTRERLQNLKTLGLKIYWDGKYVRVQPLLNSEAILCDHFVSLSLCPPDNSQML